MIDEDDDLAARIVDPLAGDTDEVELLRGRYEPLDLLGEGGQGRVLRAWDHHHSHAVALKVRPIDSGTDRERILSEARALVGLQPHRNVAVIRDDFFEGDHHYLVLDWVAGDDLKSRMRREGVPGLPFALVSAVVADIAEALDHLHGHEPPIVHGDVKPGNIVVSEGDPPHAVLVDFGLASHGDREASGGTLAYAAPETLVGMPPSPRSDVYSLAATTFELLTGRVPGPDRDARLVERARAPRSGRPLGAGGRLGGGP